MREFSLPSNNPHEAADPNETKVTSSLFFNLEKSDVDRRLPTEDRYEDLEPRLLVVHLVDETKHRLPVWKHQVFTDGTDEWVNCA